MTVQSEPSIPKRVRNPLDFPTVTLIGFGNWGTALAHGLTQADVPLREIIVRTLRARDRKLASSFRTIGATATATTLDHAALDADVFWICTPDASIAGIAADLARRLAHRRALRRSRPCPIPQPPGKGPVIFHSSCALSSSELEVLRTAGASTGTVHPLMTFPPQSRAPSRPHSPSPTAPRFALAGIPFAIEGDARAMRCARLLVKALHGKSFSLPAASKPLYHAFGSFASPLLVALLQATAHAGMAVGYSRGNAMGLMQPIVEQTISNFFRHGAEKSFSGPMARGDVATIASHMRALEAYPSLTALYRELGAFALTALPNRRSQEIEQVLLGSRKDSPKKSP